MSKHITGHTNDAAVVHHIRTVCARELGTPYDYPFFSMSWPDPNGDPDTQLLDLFWGERAHHGTDEQTLLVMCHG